MDLVRGLALSSFADFVKIDVINWCVISKKKMIKFIIRYTGETWEWNEQAIGTFKQVHT